VAHSKGILTDPSQAKINHDRPEREKNRYGLWCGRGCQLYYILTQSICTWKL